MVIGFADYIRTRQALWLQKTYGQPALNWTTQENIDQLKNFHLTNNFRETDRGTLYVINELQWNSDTVLLAVHRTLLYRFFNSEVGYNRYISEVQDLRNPSEFEINYVLNQPGNFSGAYIRTVARKIAVESLQSMYQHAGTVVNHLELNSTLDDPEKIRLNREMIRAELGRIPSFGNFLADQLMLDFCWIGNPWSLEFSPGLGPGAKRGLERLGIDFKQAHDQAIHALDGLPLPHVLLFFGQGLGYTPVPVPVTEVVVEHALCEAEKIWKWNDALEEGAGRKVKMRKYQEVGPREANAKPALSPPIPRNWLAPKFS